MTPIYRDTQLTFQHRVRIIVIGPNTGDDRWQIYQKYFTKIVGDGWAGLVLKLDLDIIRI